MKIFYDLEFHERGPRYPIELISIGMVREDGAELYLINDEVDLTALRHHPWLCKNVVPHLPLRWVHPQARPVPSLIHVEPDVLDWDRDHEDHERAMPPWEIAERVRAFVLNGGDPELWAWYGAYDHVVMCQQLFGRMVDLPAGFPMWTNDIRQLSELCGNPMLPAQDAAGHHRAIDDARWNAEAWRYLDTGLSVTWRPWSVTDRETLRRGVQD